MHTCDWLEEIAVEERELLFERDELLLLGLHESVNERFSSQTPSPPRSKSCVTLIVWEPGPMTGGVSGIGGIVLDSGTVLQFISEKNVPTAPSM